MIWSNKKTPPKNNENENSRHHCSRSGWPHRFLKIVEIYLLEGLREFTSGSWHNGDKDGGSNNACKTIGPLQLNFNCMAKWLASPIIMWVCIFMYVLDVFIPEEMKSTCNIKLVEELLLLSIQTSQSLSTTIPSSSRKTIISYWFETIFIVWLS